MNSSSPGHRGKTLRLPSPAAACTMRSLRLETKFHHMWRWPSGSPPISTTRASPSADSMGSSPGASTTIVVGGTALAVQLHAALHHVEGPLGGQRQRQGVAGRQAMSRYSVGERTTTGEWRQRPAHQHAQAGTAHLQRRQRPAGVCTKDGAISSSAAGSASPQLQAVVRRVWPRRSAGVRSACTMPRPAVIQLMAPGSMRCTAPVESVCCIAPSNR
jgi:hypothetical protein